MSTATQAPPEDLVEMVMTFDVGPGGLDRFLDAVPRLPGRLSYRDGRVTIVSPTLTHERGVWVMNSVVEAVATELEIAFHVARSTLFRRDDGDRGIEPDGSFYFENRAAIRGISGAIDLRIHPPPDLVVEVVWTHKATVSLEICRAMGVPEVWCYDIPSLAIQFLHLEPEAGYAPRIRSRAFPFLAPGDVQGQVRALAAEEDDGRVLRQLRAWARDELGPRRAGGG